MEEKIRSLLGSIIHPAEKQDLVSLGMVSNVKAGPDEVFIILQMKKVKDPFAAKLKKAVESAVGGTFPQYAGRVNVIVKDAPAKEVKKAPAMTGTQDIKKVIAVSSGKGGVGKSTVTANLAMALADRGCRVGVLDTDIYGPSMPKMFGVEGYAPAFVGETGHELMLPAESRGVRIMSIGFFIRPTDALVWRGPMATNALKQLIHQTRWGELDYLLIDLPPGTGDVHLTVLGELPVDGAVIVSTPQSIALADVVRGIEMFTKENIAVPILGLIENMAWFTPADEPEKKYYVFGKEGVKRLAEERGMELLAQIPLVLGAGEYREDDALDVRNNAVLKAAYGGVAGRIAEKSGSCGGADDVL